MQRLSGDPPSPWEGRFAFSRVTRAGQLVFVAGTTSVDAQGVVQGATPHEQARIVLEKIARELARVGASLQDVVLTRVYVTDIARAEEVGQAHREAFEGAPPAMTMVEVRGLIDPRMLVEIEAIAIARPAIGSTKQ